MTAHVLLGIGAGLVSALLFSVVSTGSTPGVLLLYLAPLPILIVALGWHHLCGLLALAVGAAATSIALRSSAGIAFALGPALPAWGLAYLALLARPDIAAAGPDEARRPDVAWYPAGSLLLWVGLAGALVALISSVAIGGFDHAVYQDRLRRLVGAFLRYQAGAGRDGPLPTIAGIPGATLVGAVVAIAPAGLAALLAVVMAVNLWGAAKVVSISGRLRRPWPSLAATRMPLPALAILAAGLGLGQLPGYPGIAGIATVGGLSMVFALQGLAFLHDVTRGRAGRGAVLALAYLLTLFFGQAILPLLALTGMADTATSVRTRLLARGSGRGNPPAR